MSGPRRDGEDDSPPDQGRAGWDQVAGQDQLHWSDQRPSEEKARARSVGMDGTSDKDVPDEEDHGRNANLDRSPRNARPVGLDGASHKDSDDGFADYQAKRDDDTPDSNWDQDDYRRTEFAGSLDGTNHPTHPPDVEGQPPLTLRPD